MGALDDIVKSSQVIYNEKLSVFKKFDISESVANENVKWCIDRGSNMTAFEQGDSIRLNCLAHVLNNICEEMCKKNGSSSTNHFSCISFSYVYEEIGAEFAIEKDIEVTR